MHILLAVMAHPLHQASMLADYIEVSDTPFQSPSFPRQYARDSFVAPSAECDGVYLLMKKHVSQWPADLRQEWLDDIRLLFSPRSEGFDSDVQFAHSVCLCCEVKKCPIRDKAGLPAGTDHHTCTRNAFGLCVEATSMMNGGAPVSFTTIALFAGVAKQRIHQIYKKALRRIVAAIKEDPVLREHVVNYGLGPD